MKTKHTSLKSELLQALKDCHKRLELYDSWYSHTEFKVRVEDTIKKATK